MKAKCPNCQAMMESEESTLPKLGRLSDDVKPKRHLREILLRCEECGLEAKWTKRGGVEVTFDPRTQAYAGN